MTIFSGRCPRVLACCAVATVGVGGAYAAAADEPVTAASDITESKATESEASELGKEESQTPTPVPAEFHQTISVSAHHPVTPSETLKKGEDIETWGSEDLGGLLRRQPGLEAVRRGALGLDPQVRGLREGQLAVFVDGTRTFAAGPGRMDSGLAHISPRAVETLRVVKGPYALEWGAGAMAAIYLNTHRGSFAEALSELVGRVGVDLGSNGDPYDAYASVSSGGRRLRWHVLAQRRAGEDYEDGEGREIPGDYESTDLRWNVDTVLSSQWQLGYAGGRQRQDDIDYAGRLLDATFFETKSHDLTLNGSWKRFDVIQVQVYRNDKSHAMNNDAKPTAQPMAGRMPPFAIAVDLPASSATSGGRMTASWSRGNWFSTVGVDHFVVDQNATRTIRRRDNGMAMFRNAPWPDVRIQDTGAHFRTTYRGDAWTVGATIRFDEASSQARGTSTDRHDDDLIGLALSGRRRLNHRWTLIGGLGVVSRLPSALERYADQFPATRFQVAAEFLGDPLLQPETSRQLDLGMEVRGGRWDGSLSLFHRNVDDYITVLPDPSVPRLIPMSPQLVYRYQNGTKATFDGGELQLRWRAAPKWELSSSVSWLRGTDEEFNEPAFGVPPLRAWLGGLFRATANLDVELTWMIESGQDRVATTRKELPTPGYGRGDLALAWNRSNWRYKLVVENLTDKNYSRHLNSTNPFSGQRVPERGRSVRGAVEWRF